MRSFDMTMPEEINRRVADSIATICLAPTERALANLELEGRGAHSFLVGDTLGYLDFLALLAQARLVLTDSGGVQQEASILNVPCFTLRHNTEWIETVEAGKNRLVGTDTRRIVQIVSSVWDDEQIYQAMQAAESPFLEGAAQRILALICGEENERLLQIESSDFLRDGLPPR